MKANRRQGRDRCTPPCVRARAIFLMLVMLVAATLACDALGSGVKSGDTGAFAEETEEPEEEETEESRDTGEQSGLSSDADIRFEVPIRIADRAGEILGDGQVRLYVPPSVQVGDTVEVLLEIEVGELSIGELNPEPSPTPIMGTPRPTSTPPPLLEAQFVQVREWMGADVRGLDEANFDIRPVPPDGLRHMQAQAVNWWKWNISPIGENAIGVNSLEVFVFLPNTLEDGTPFNEEVNIIPFEIEVLAAPTATPTSTPRPTATATTTPTPDFLGRVDQGFVSLVDTWLARVLTIGAVVGLVYSAYRFIAARLKKPETASQTHKDSDKGTDPGAKDKRS